MFHSGRLLNNGNFPVAVLPYFQCIRTLLFWIFFRKSMNCTCVVTYIRRQLIIKSNPWTCRSISRRIHLLSVTTKLLTRVTTGRHRQWYYWRTINSPFNYSRSVKWNRLHMPYRIVEDSCGIVRLHDIAKDHTMCQRSKLQ